MRARIATDQRLASLILAIYGLSKRPNTSSRHTTPRSKEARTSLPSQGSALSRWLTLVILAVADRRLPGMREGR